MKHKFQEFLDDLLAAILKKYRDKIFSIVIYGSFATRRGKEGSDIDMIIQFKKDISRKELHDANDIATVLSIKHGVDAVWMIFVPFLRYIHPPIIVAEYDEIEW